MSCHRDPRMMSDYASRLVRLAKEVEKAERVAKRDPSALTAAALNEALAAEALLWEEALPALARQQSPASSLLCARELVDLLLHKECAGGGGLALVCFGEL